MKLLYILIILITEFYTFADLAIPYSCLNENVQCANGQCRVYDRDVSYLNYGVNGANNCQGHLSVLHIDIFASGLDGYINLDILDSKIQYLSIKKHQEENIEIRVSKDVSLLRFDLTVSATALGYFNLTTTNDTNVTDFFSYFPKLVDLEIDRPILKVLPSFVNKSDMTKIRVMHAIVNGGNNVSVPDSFVASLTELRTLSWANSSLTQLSENAFEGLYQLTELDLDGNRLTNNDINNLNMESLGNLEILDLSQNKITNTKRAQFRFLKSLTELRINNNPGYDPQQDEYLPLRGLVRISMNNNQFTELDHRPFQQKENLTHIQLLGNNDFNCTCKMQWISIVTMKFLTIEIAIGDCDSSVTGANTNAIKYENFNVTECSQQQLSYDCFSPDLTCTVDETCYNTVAASECSCNNGLRPTGDGKGCEDINECDNIAMTMTNNTASFCEITQEYYKQIKKANGNVTCQQGCINRIGDYICLCCEGYKKISIDNDDPICKDINECDNSPCKKSTCLNTNGSFICNCVMGFEKMSDTVCIDIGECERGLDNCTQDCINTIGSYYCECFAGFIFLNKNESRHIGEECFDKDECELDADNCTQNCHNTYGSFNCSCDAGYDQIGFNNCTDINECRTGGEHNCTGLGVGCVNAPGNYTCTCVSGYQAIAGNLNPNFPVCEEIQNILPIIIGGAGGGTILFLLLFLVIIFPMLCLCYKKYSNKRKSRVAGSTEDNFLERNTSPIYEKVDVNGLSAATKERKISEKNEIATEPYYSYISSEATAIKNNNTNESFDNKKVRKQVSFAGNCDFNEIDQLNNYYTNDLRLSIESPLVNNNNDEVCVSPGEQSRISGSEECLIYAQNKLIIEDLEDEEDKKLGSKLGRKYSLPLIKKSRIEEKRKTSFPIKFERETNSDTKVAREVEF